MVIKIKLTEKDDVLTISVKDANVGFIRNYYFPKYDNKKDNKFYYIRNTKEHEIIKLVASVNKIYLTELTSIYERIRDSVLKYNNFRIIYNKESFAKIESIDGKIKIMYVNEGNKVELYFLLVK